MDLSATRLRPSPRLLRQIRRVLMITVLGIILAFCYTKVITLIDGVEYSGRIMALAATSGGIVGYFLGVLEFAVIPSNVGRPLREAPFILAILMRAVLATLLILVGLVIANSLFSPDRFLEDGIGIVFRDSVAAFLLFFVVFFFLQMQHIVGGRVLVNFILGRYYRPIREDRIFLFLDVIGSTGHARTLGDIGLQKMVTRFFFDIGEPIDVHGGEIHRYIGDEVVVTWRLAEGIEDAQCIRCYFAIVDTIEAKKEAYVRLFGTVPKFRVGLHGGTVVSSECGDEKKEIVYFGDTINTAARVEQACKEVGQPFLVSGDLMAQITLPPEMTAQSTGRLQLRGRAEETELFTVARA